MKKGVLTLLFVVFSLFITAQTVVTFYTSMGRFAVEIYDNKVPITGGNFLDLADTNFYDGIIFHRVIDGFMIQGGDPTGTGSGGPGYNIQDEFDATLSNVQKTISMANTGQPNSGGSQFFINLVDNTGLDYNKAPLTSKHAVFGMVIQNFSVVEDIGKVSTDGSDRPITPVVIDSIRRGNNVTVGVESTKNTLENINIYPSPAKDQFQIDGLQNTAIVQIIDITGKVVYEGQNEAKESIDISTLYSGIYFVRIKQDAAVVNRRLVIQ